MAYWLFKSEPSAWSWSDQQRDGTAEWDGVRNWQAAGNMKKMALGDQGFFYHSIKEKRIVGIVEIMRLYYPDPTDASGRFGMVDVKALQSLPQPVTLEQLKADAAFADLPLIRQSRLSVMPIDDDSWQRICRLGGL